MSAPGGRTEIFDFEAGDASEARVYYSGNSRWGVDKSTLTLLGVAKEIRCPTNVRIQRTNPHPNF